MKNDKCALTLLEVGDAAGGRGGEMKQGNRVRKAASALGAAANPI